MKCTSCGKQLKIAKYAVVFSCPACNNVKIARCANCKILGTPYICTGCKFTGP